MYSQLIRYIPSIHLRTLNDEKSHEKLSSILSRFFIHHQIWIHRKYLQMIKSFLYHLRQVARIDGKDVQQTWIQYLQGNCWWNPALHLPSWHEEQLLSQAGSFLCCHYHESVRWTQMQKIIRNNNSNNYEYYYRYEIRIKPFLE